MKKAYLRYLIQLCIAGVVVSVVVIVGGFVALSEPEWEKAAPGLLALMVQCFVLLVPVTFILSLRFFCVGFDDDGIWKGFLRKKILWKDVEIVKLEGIPYLRFSNQVIFISDDAEIAVEISVFKHQEEVLKLVSNALPWTGALDLRNLPKTACKNSTSE